jgi:D-sedoheptulose 7-phosphate isomerase
MSSKDQAVHYLRETALETRRIQEKFNEEHSEDIVRAAEAIGHCVSNGGKVLILGNGGSAADAQHMAAEMVGRMLVERRALPAIALTTDSSNLTALGNDYGYEHIFSRQIEALSRPGDVVVAISTSGQSPNVVRAAEAAKKNGCILIAMTGGTGGKLLNMADIRLNVSLGKNSCRIQESHIFAVHSMIDLLDRFFLKGAPS